jgi:LmbE family N-acetylglucosaminyl deacetylase
MARRRQHAAPRRGASPNNVSESHARFDPRAPVCFLSPHLDDVALSCGHYLVSHPGSTVVTVFAGAPPIASPRDWNGRTTGEAFAPAALEVRRREDAEALAMLCAQPRWLDLWESEYLTIPFGSVAAARGLARLPRAARVALARTLGPLRASTRTGRSPIMREVKQVLEAIRPASVVAPLGLHHADHLAVSAVAVTLSSWMRLDWYLYEELPYALDYPRETGRRLSRLRSSVTLTACDPVAPSDDAKAAAVRAYVSQRSVLEAGFGAFQRSLATPEQYWQIVPARAHHGRTDPA